MAGVAPQIDAVNRAADGLLESGHPRSPQVRQCQQQLNERYVPEWRGGCAPASPPP